jgi:hypothetical protein
MIVKLFYIDEKKVASKELQKMNLLQNFNNKHVHPWTTASGQSCSNKIVKIFKTDFYWKLF